MGAMEFNSRSAPFYGHAGLTDRAYATGHAYGQMHAPYYKLPMRFNVSRLQEEIVWLRDTHGWTLRPDVKNYFVLLVNHKGEEANQVTLGPFRPVETRLAHRRLTNRRTCAHC